MRLDQRMISEGLARSRSKAQQLILAGVVEVAGQLVSKPSAQTAGVIHVHEDPCPWVSRAALKLLHALEVFNLTPQGTALDVGASTGGFTEVLLARGAEHVYALDVGHGQLDASLACNPRVTNLEGINARAIPEGLVPAVQWITADLSFVSLGKVLPGVLPIGAAGAHLVVLVKPQFEAGPARVGKNGIVADPAVHDEVVAEARTGIERLGWTLLGQTESPILGADGNREFLIAARRAA